MKYVKTIAEIQLDGMSGKVRISCGRCWAISPACTPPSTRWTGRTSQWLRAVASTACDGIETPHYPRPPGPVGASFPGTRQAVLIERYATITKNGTWVTRMCETVLYITSRDADATTAQDLLAHVRGHWTAEHLHRQRSGDTDHHQPCHHLVPAAWSNRLRSRRPAQRPEPPPDTPASEPLTRLNRFHDFDQSQHVRLG